MIVVVMLISTELSQVKAVEQYDHSRIQSRVILNVLLIREKCSLHVWMDFQSQPGNKMFTSSNSSRKICINKCGLILIQALDLVSCFLPPAEGSTLHI